MSKGDVSRAEVEFALAFLGYIEAIKWEGAYIYRSRLGPPEDIIVIRFIRGSISAANLERALAASGIDVSTFWAYMRD